MKFIWSWVNTNHYYGWKVKITWNRMNMGLYMLYVFLGKIRVHLGFYPKSWDQPTSFPKATMKLVIK